MHPNEIDLNALDKIARKKLRREAERLGPGHVEALNIQRRRQSAPEEEQVAA